MARAKLICVFCKEPIRVSKEDHDHQFEYPRGPLSALERGWHVRCRPDYAEPDNPLQAAIQRAKQAIADARRLTESEYGVFRSIVEIALTEQRPDLSPTPSAE